MKILDTSAEKLEVSVDFVGIRFGVSLDVQRQKFFRYF
jgi:hypothetical protein